jgi:hypothetical protein
MDSKLTPEELRWLRMLDTDAPEKPDLPGPIGDRLVEYGLAIRLVEGGLQLTAFGREHLLNSGNPKA